MAKQGMKRPAHPEHVSGKHQHNTVPPVPELSGKAKSGKEKANPIIAGTASPNQKVWHSGSFSAEKPIASVYAVIDTDLARDNLENDIPAADLQDL